MVDKVERCYDNEALSLAAKRSTAQHHMQDYLEHKARANWMHKGQKLLDYALTQKPPQVAAFFADDVLMPMLAANDARLGYGARIAACTRSEFGGGAVNLPVTPLWRGRIPALLNSQQKEQVLTLLYARQMDEAALAKCAEFLERPDARRALARVEELLLECGRRIAADEPAEVLGEADRDKATQVVQLLKRAYREPLGLLSTTPERRDTTLAVVTRGLSQNDLTLLLEFFQGQAGAEYLRAHALAADRLEKYTAPPHVPRALLRAPPPVPRTAGPPPASHARGAA